MPLSLSVIQVTAWYENVRARMWAWGVLRNFEELGLEVYGVDISEEVKEFSKTFPVEICDVENDLLPYEDSSFDVIYSKSFIEHLYYPERYLKEAYRVLKPGGKLITLVPDWESNYKIYFDDFTHRTPFTNIALSDAYKMYGFEGVSVYKFRQLPLLWKYPSLNYLSAIITPFVSARTTNKFLRWSRELMLIGYGVKPEQ